MSTTTYMRRAGKAPASQHIFESLALEGSGRDLQCLLRERRAVMRAQKTDVAGTSGMPLSGSTTATSDGASSTAEAPGLPMPPPAAVPPTKLVQAKCAPMPSSAGAPKLALVEDSPMASYSLFDCLALEGRASQQRPSRRSRHSNVRGLAAAPGACCVAPPKGGAAWKPELSQKGDAADAARRRPSSSSQCESWGTASQGDDLSNLPAFLRELLLEGQEKNKPEFIDVTTCDSLGYLAAVDTLSETSSR